MAALGTLLRIRMSRGLLPEISLGQVHTRILLMTRLAIPLLQGSPMILGFKVPFQAPNGFVFVGLNQCAHSTFLVVIVDVGLG